MIAYFDTSAIIPLLIDEPLSGLADTVWRQAAWVATARLSYVEARSGLARACRTGRISADELSEAVGSLEKLHRRSITWKNHSGLGGESRGPGRRHGIEGV